MLPSIVLTPIGGVPRGGTGTGSTKADVAPGERVDYADRIAQITRDDALAAADRVAAAISGMVTPGEPVNYDARKDKIGRDDALAAADRAAANPSYGYESKNPGGDFLSSNSLDPFAGIIGDVMESFGGMLGTLGSVQAILDPLSTIIKGAFDVLSPMIDSILEPINNILLTFGEIIGGALSPFLEFLSTTILPLVMAALKGLAVVLEVLMSPVRWLGDMFTWVGEQLQIFVYNLWHLNNKDYTSFESDAFSGLAERIAEIWSNDYSSSSLAGNSIETDTTSNSGASYTGTRNITLNFYNQGNVVGSGGLEELAALLATYIKREERYA